MDTTKLLLICLFLFFFFLSSITSANYYPKGVYGTDNRYDIFSGDATIKEMGRAVVAKIGSSHLLKTDNGYKIVGQTLEESRNVCKDEKFADQISAASCSGFLVSEDIVITAGHCMLHSRDCATSSWAFDYQFDGVSEDINIDASSVYRCVNFKREYGLDRFGNKRDYGVIKLDRVVPDRIPLAIRNKGVVKKGAEVFVIGFSDGTPMKAADDGFIRNVSRTVFKTNLDTFFKNSGSPVINAKTLEVEGILVSGDNDYEYDAENSCLRIKRYEMDSGLGESVTKISLVKKSIALLR